jgi:hypothetical protein
VKSVRQFFSGISVEELCFLLSDKWKKTAVKGVFSTRQRDRLAFLHRFLCVNNNGLLGEWSQKTKEFKKDFNFIRACLSINFLFTFRAVEKGRSDKKVEIRKGLLNLIATKGSIMHH